MSGQRIGKKMMKTKREQLLAIENMNSSALDHLLGQYQQLLDQIVLFQVDFIAIRQILISRGYTTDLEIEQMKKTQAELRKMESEAIII